MTRGTTPTITVTVPQSVDLTLATNVYATMKQNGFTLCKSGDVLTLTAHSCSFTLTQAESLRFVANTDAEIQLNWTYDNGLRGSIYILTLPVYDNLEGRVLA